MATLELQVMELEGGIESSGRRVVDLEGQLDELLSVNHELRALCDTATTAAAAHGQARAHEAAEESTKEATSSPPSPSTSLEGDWATAPSARVLSGMVNAEAEVVELRGQLANMTSVINHLRGQLLASNISKSAQAGSQAQTGARAPALARGTHDKKRRLRSPLPRGEEEDEDVAAEEAAGGAGAVNGEGGGTPLGHASDAGLRILQRTPTTAATVSTATLIPSESPVAFAAVERFEQMRAMRAKHHAHGGIDGDAGGDAGGGVSSGTEGVTGAEYGSDESDGGNNSVSKSPLARDESHDGSHAGSHNDSRDDDVSSLFPDIDANANVEAPVNGHALGDHEAEGSEKVVSPISARRVSFESPSLRTSPGSALSAFIQRVPTNRSRLQTSPDESETGTPQSSTGSMDSGDITGGTTHLDSGTSPDFQPQLEELRKELAAAEDKLTGAYQVAEEAGMVSADLQSQLSAAEAKLAYAEEGVAMSEAIQTKLGEYPILTCM